LQLIYSLEISEILDLCSLKCYKRVEKRSTSKFKVQKNDKSKTKSVQFCQKKYGNLAAILENLSQLIGLLFLSDSSAIVELRS